MSGSFAKVATVQTNFIIKIWLHVYMFALNIENVFSYIQYKTQYSCFIVL